MPKDMTQTPDIFTRRESAARSYCRGMPARFVRASGAELIDSEGNSYIDFLAGCSSLNYGHNDPDMKSALIEHIATDGIAHGLDLHTDAKAAFLEAFERHILAPRDLDHRVMFTGPTGANAVEAALKIARKATGRTNVIAFTNGFHGVTMGALAATGNGYHRGGAGMDTAGVTRLPFDGYAEGVDGASLLDQMLSDPSGGLDAPAAILLETVQGEGGLNAASPYWVQRIAEVAKKHGALLIVDDIQAGVGRTGSFFSFEGMGVTPDIVTLAKSLSGFGLPMAVVLVRPDFDVFGPAEHNGTFRGNQHAFVTARVAIEKFWADDRFQRELVLKSDLITRALDEIGALIPGARIKGRGMMLGLDVHDGALAGAICVRAYDKGLVIETSGNRDQVIKILAPLTTPTQTLQKGFELLRQAAFEVMTETQAMAAE